jgi:hypothetical protein
MMRCGAIERRSRKNRCRAARPALHAGRNGRAIETPWVAAGSASAHCSATTARRASAGSSKRGIHAIADHLDHRAKVCPDRRTAERVVTRQCRAHPVGFLFPQPVLPSMSVKRKVMSTGLPEFKKIL